MQTDTLVNTSARALDSPAPDRKVERLPFTVRLVSDTAALQKAVHIRQAAYGRHIPELAKALGEPETYDSEPGVMILLAESKLDGAPIGTMRIHTNASNRLGVEKSVILPAWLQGQRLSEAVRLGVSHGTVGHLAKAVLFKAYYQYCLANHVQWMITAARSPLDRQYEALLFKEVFPGQGYIPMLHIGNIPHRVMAFDVKSAEQRWREARHPMFDFMIRTHHPDLDIGLDTLNPRHGLPGTSATSDHVSVAA